MKIKLGGILKVLSTILIAAGIADLFLFVNRQNRSLLDIFDQPSYYAMQNYKMLFLAGIAVVAFSVLGSFFSWSDKIDPKEEVLMNAGYTSAQNIETWLKGSTANEESGRLTTQEEAKTEELKATTIIGNSASEETTVLSNADSASETTIIEPAYENEWAADTELENESTGKETDA